MSVEGDKLLVTAERHAGKEGGSDGGTRNHSPPTRNNLTNSLEEQENKL